MQLLSNRGPLSAALILMLAAGAAFAAETPVFKIKMNEKEFQPSELTVPAGKKIKLEVTNTGPTVAEFESYELNREKILVGGSTGTFYIGPLNPADYRFFNDFNKNVKGRIIAQ